MSTCVPTPVSTVFSTVIENIITTTYSLSTSTVPPKVTTRVEPYCQNEAVLLDSTVCLRTGTRTSIETLQPTSDVVYTIPYEITIPVTTDVPINTVYSGCSDTPTNPGEHNSGVIGQGPGPKSSNGPNPGPNGNSGGAISVPPGHMLVTSSVLVYTTGPPVTSMIPSFITLPNGQVTITSVLTVVTPKPSQVYVPTTTLVEATGKSSPDSAGNLGVIVGAVIGGFVGLCLMILAWWYVRRRRETTYDEILYEHEKQIDDQEARRQAIERSKDPNRKRESDPRPTPYHYGSLLSGGSSTHISTSTGVALSQNPFEGADVGTRATYLAQGSPLFTTVPIMGEFGVTGVGASASGVRRLNPSASSIFCTSGTVPAMNSTPTLGTSSGSSYDLDHPRPDGSADEFIEIDIGGTGTGIISGSRVISPPPHLSMSFGSWNTGTSNRRGSGGSRRSSGMDSGTDPGPDLSDRGHGSEEDEGERRLLRPQQRYTVESHTTAALVQTETVREDARSHLRKRSGSPVSWASPARGTLFIVNHRNSGDF